MSTIGRPPFGTLICEAIDRALHEVDKTHWPLITAFRVQKHSSLDTPVPPPARQHLLQAIRQYAIALFDTEADQFERVRQNQEYQIWLSRLAERTNGRVLTALDRLDESDPESIMLAYHGLQKRDIVESLREALWERTRDYSQGHTPSHLSQKLQETQSSLPKPSKPTREPRMSASIVSPSAARKMEAYMNAHGLDQTQFAIQAQTTDKTIRKFRQTGRVKRSILDGIASAMGVKKEDLLKQ